MELAELKQIYSDYETALAQAHRKTNLLSGLFGQGSFDDPRGDPCNRAFYQQSEAWLTRFAESGPSEREAEETVRFVLEAAARDPKAHTYWYYLVAQEHVRQLIPLLSPESCRVLQKEYDALYPKRKRYPIQNALYEQLSRRGQEA